MRFIFLCDITRLTNRRNVREKIAGSNLHMQKMKKYETDTGIPEVYVGMTESMFKNV